MRDVSPIDESRGTLNIPKRTKGRESHIPVPVLRNTSPVVRGETQPVAAQKFWQGKVAPNSKVRWDEYSGEPTASNAGKKGQVQPASYAVHPAQQHLGNHVTVTGPTIRGRANSPFGNRLGFKPSTSSKRSQEPWSRASGRTEIAQPLKDQPFDSGLHPAFRQQAETWKKLNEGRESPVPAIDAQPTNSPKNATDMLNEYNSHQQPIKPPVPLKLGRNTPQRDPSSPVSPQNQSNQALHPYPSPITPTNNHYSDSIANA